MGRASGTFQYRSFRVHLTTQSSYFFCLLFIYILDEYVVYCEALLNKFVTSNLPTCYTDQHLFLQRRCSGAMLGS